MPYFLGKYLVGYFHNHITMHEFMNVKDKKRLLRDKTVSCHSNTSVAVKFSNTC